jgi:hypothetical protein
MIREEGPDRYISENYQKIPLTTTIVRIGVESALLAFIDSTLL